jgi:hypothetical protein
MTRVHFMFVTSIAAGCLLQTPAAADDFDGKWTGTINCAKLSFTKGPFKVPMEMTVDKGAASYVRDVYNKDGTQVVGTGEGTGTIGEGGKLTLTGRGSPPSSGRATPTRRPIRARSRRSPRASKARMWKSADGKSENRACTIALKR